MQCVARILWPRVRSDAGRYWAGWWQARGRFLLKDSVGTPSKPFLNSCALYSSKDRSWGFFPKALLQMVWMCSVFTRVFLQPLSMPMCRCKLLLCAFMLANNAAFGLHLLVSKTYWPIYGIC